MREERVTDDDLETLHAGAGKGQIARDLWWSLAERSLPALVEELRERRANERAFVDAVRAPHVEEEPPTNPLSLDPPELFFLGGLAHKDPPLAMRLDVRTAAWTDEERAQEQEHQRREDAAAWDEEPSR